MLKIKTSKPLVMESQDYLAPIGNISDNHFNISYLNEIEEFFNKKKLSILDLGCAGGQFVVEANLRNHIAVGIDGVDHVLFNKNAAGHHNWKKYYEKYFFLTDMGVNFEILENNLIYKFDLISAWEVVEHIFPQNMNIFLTNIVNHLKSNGLFIGSISGHKHQWHPSASIDRELWTKKFAENNLTFEEYKFNNVLRNDVLLPNSNSILFSSRIISNES